MMSKAPSSATPNDACIRRTFSATRCSWVPENRAPATSAPTTTSATIARASAIPRSFFSTCFIDRSFRFPFPPGPSAAEPRRYRARTTAPGGPQASRRHPAIRANAGHRIPLELRIEPLVIIPGLGVAFPVDQDRVTPAECLPIAVNRRGSNGHHDLPQADGELRRRAHEGQLPHGADADRIRTHESDVAINRVQLPELGRQDRRRGTQVLVQIDRLCLRQVEALIVDQHLVYGGGHDPQERERDQQFDEGEPTAG